MIAETLARVVNGDRLSSGEMKSLLQALIETEGSELQIAALLTALRTRGETLEELVGAADAMRELAVSLPAAPEGAVDTCGTGGDRSGTFNISTGSALVVSACGVPVAKHGNRAASSRCGSADVLEALGVRIDQPPERAAAAVREIGIGFLFARTCHPAMARVAPIRAALGFPTLFNRLGPLTNPMRVRRQLVGVSQPAHAEPMLECLVQLGAERAWVVHAEDGLDEISPCAATQVWSYEEGVREQFSMDPGRFVPKGASTDLLGGEAAHNAGILRSVLAGEPSPARDAVVLNAAAVLVVAKGAADLDEGVERAGAALDAGDAKAVLDRWVAFTGAKG
ncbi:MAG: anthranilate phosphoribosyltransferase [Myxococcota bacterium]